MHLCHIARANKLAYRIVNKSYSNEDNFFDSNISLWWVSTTHMLKYCDDDADVSLNSLWQ